MVASVKPGYLQHLTYKMTDNPQHNYTTWDHSSTGSLTTTWPKPTDTGYWPPKIETVPGGLDMNTPGAKADSGKNRVHLCISGFANALEKVAEVTTIGANKYSPNGWKQVPEGYNRYMDAFGRHYLKYLQGEKLDTGSGGTGCYHLAQMIWNLMAAFELELKNG